MSPQSKIKNLKSVGFRLMCWRGRIELFGKE